MLISLVCITFRSMFPPPIALIRSLVSGSDLCLRQRDSSSRYLLAPTNMHYRPMPEQIAIIDIVAVNHGRIHTIV